MTREVIKIGRRKLNLPCVDLCKFHRTETMPEMKEKIWEKT